MVVYTCTCMGLVNGVCMYGPAAILAFCSITGITGISLSVDTHLYMAILTFYAMHLRVQLTAWAGGPQID